MSCKNLKLQTAKPARKRQRMNMGKWLYQMALQALCTCFGTLRGGKLRSNYSGKYVLLLGFIALAVQKMPAQRIIPLDRCGFSYIDPQNENEPDVPTRDSMLYTEYFSEDSLLKAFYVDINAFGAQQVDRTRVFAILPDSSLQLLGEMAFGNCPECVQGFALVDNGALQVQNVNNRNTMDMWLQGFGQPPFRLTGNLQSLRGVGRISGRIPFCAIGWQVQYSIFNTPNITSTEFSTHILCPQIIANCPITTRFEIDCQNDSLHLQAQIPIDCFSDQLTVGWSNSQGFTASTPNTSRALTGNLGRYYLTLRDEGCTRVDSVEVTNPPFATAGADVAVCQDEPVELAGTGGFGHYWQTPAGTIVRDSVLLFANANPEQAGFYILNAVNEQNCTDTDTLLLTVHVPPDPEIDFTMPCLGDSLVLQLRNDSVYTQIIWRNPQGAVLSPPTVPDFQVVNIGNYSLQITDNQGCETINSIYINGNEPPELALLIEEGCDSTRVQLAPETYLYEWAAGAVGPYFATATGGLFQVRVTDPTGCTAITDIRLPAPEGPNLAVTTEQPRCPGDLGAIEIQSNNPDRPLIFSIDGGETFSVNKRFRDLPYGRYLVIVQDALGCTQKTPVSIVPPDTMGVTLNIDSLEVRPGTPITLIANTVGNIRAYEWLPIDINSGGPSTSFNAAGNLNVRIIVEDTRGCRASDGFFLSVAIGDLYAPSAFSPNGDGVNDQFTLYSDNGSGEIIERLQIFDRWGNVLFTTEKILPNDDAQGWDGTCRGKPAPPGVYMYHALVRFGNGVEKFYTGDLTLVR